MNDQEIYEKAFSQLFAPAMPTAKPPLLAHYTSIKVMESIFCTDEIWLSNPLFMNDMQEIRFGLREGQRLFLNPDLLRKAVDTDQRMGILANAFTTFFGQHDTHDVFDTYVFCLSEHESSNMDGVLSMWRGYGHHGDGVALVFDPAAVTLVPTSPLVIYKVIYATDDDRLKQLGLQLEKWADLTAQAALSDDKLFLAAHAALTILKIFSLTAKHIGFLGEAEWRVVYFPDRDRGGLLKEYMSYEIGERGVEPKLKFKIAYLPDVTANDLTLQRLVERIILGPSLSSPLAMRSVQRMLDKIGKPEFMTRVFASRIPLRPARGGVF
jgi:hypothetical protein